jgi:phosphatidylglycerophosphate synthase
MRRVPNAISIIRMALSLTLFFLVENPLAFSLVYGICGLSDLMDGILARKLKAASPLGAKLDSLADLIFVTVVVSTLVFFTDILNNLFAFICIGTSLIVKGINLIIQGNRLRNFNDRIVGSSSLDIRASALQARLRLVPGSSHPRFACFNVRLLAPFRSLFLAWGYKS